MEEHRLHPRQQATGSPQIASVEGTARWECTLVDISAGGVRLKVEQPANVPEQFNLSLTRSRKLWRACKIVWRTETEIGAQFAKL